MKKFILSILVLSTSFLMAQNSEITTKNSWIKLGATAGIPVGDIHDASNFTAGLEVRGQYLVKPYLGLGIATGYNHYFGKDEVDDFGTIPLAATVRVYPSRKGVFLGMDAGYSFVTNVDDIDGGLYINPQLGYHNYDWNIYAHFQKTFNDGPSIQNVGIGATYNIRFK